MAKTREQTHYDEQVAIIRADYERDITWPPTPHTLTLYARRMRAAQEDLVLAQQREEADFWVEREFELARS